VIVGFSLQAGDVLIGVSCAVGAGFHVSMRRAVLQAHPRRRDPDQNGDDIPH